MFQSDAELVKRVRDVGDSAAYGELDIGADKRFLRHVLRFRPVAEDGVR